MGRQEGRDRRGWGAARRGEGRGEGAESLWGAKFPISLLCFCLQRETPEHPAAALLSSPGDRGAAAPRPWVLEGSANGSVGTSELSALRGSLGFGCGCNKFSLARLLTLG